MQLCKWAWRRAEQCKTMVILWAEIGPSFVGGSFWNFCPWLPSGWKRYWARWFFFTIFFRREKPLFLQSTPYCLSVGGCRSPGSLLFPDPVLSYPDPFATGRDLVFLLSCRSDFVRYPRPEHRQTGFWCQITKLCVHFDEELSYLLRAVRRGGCFSDLPRWVCSFLISSTFLVSPWFLLFCVLFFCIMNEILFCFQAHSIGVLL